MEQLRTKEVINITEQIDIEQSRYGEPKSFPKRERADKMFYYEDKENRQCRVVYVPGDMGMEFEAVVTADELGFGKNIVEPMFMIAEARVRAKVFLSMEKDLVESTKERWALVKEAMNDPEALATLVKEALEDLE